MPQRASSLVFLIPGFPEDEADTSCLPAVQNYVAAFARAHPDLQVHVLAFQYPFTRRTYAWKHLTVHALAGRNRRGIRRLAPWLRAIHAFHALHRQTTVRLVHSFWLTECTLVGRWLSKRYGIRHVASIGGQDARADNPYLTLLRWKDTTLTAGSSFAAETFTRHTRRSVDHVIPLGLDTTHLQHIAAPAERDIDVLGVGSLSPVKDYAAFIDVLARLVPAFPTLRACIIGEGPEYDALHRRIARYGLQEHVVLMGALPRDEVFQYMLRSRVFLHTAPYESQGYVFLEALYAGLPIVCFDVGYTGESPRVVRCASAQAQVDALGALLRASLSFDRSPVPSTEDTVRAFDAVYGLP